jgi:hypothetical protein
MGTNSLLLTRCREHRVRDSKNSVNRTVRSSVANWKTVFSDEILSRHGGTQKTANSVYKQRFLNPKFGYYPKFPYESTVINSPKKTKSTKMLWRISSPAIQKQDLWGEQERRRRKQWYFTYFVPHSGFCMLCIQWTPKNTKFRTKLRIKDRHQ